MDVQRDVLETEVWEVHYHVVVLDLARKAAFLPGDHTPEGLLDYEIGSVHPGLPVQFHQIVEEAVRVIVVRRIERNQLVEVRLRWTA